jgi:energy-converting hydrogenase Eha subunit F
MSTFLHVLLYQAFFGYVLLSAILVTGWVLFSWIPRPKKQREVLR